MRGARMYKNYLRGAAFSQKEWGDLGCKVWVALLRSKVMKRSMDKNVQVGP